MSTITAGDYSVEFTIPRKSYDDWYNAHYAQSGGPVENDISPALALKEHMSAEIERLLDDRLIRRSQ